MDNEKVYKMEFAKIYPLLVNKAVRKGRSKEEVDEIICWLTGYKPEDLERMASTSVNYEEFFNSSPSILIFHYDCIGVPTSIRLPSGS